MSDRLRLRQLLGDIADRPYAVVAQHPLGRPGIEESAVARRVITAVDRSRLAGVALYPNSDPGHEGIIRVLRSLEKQRNWRVFKSLGHEDYLRVASRAAVMVGNSSSGIIESASLGVNAVNVGRRQEGRLRCGPGVIDCGESASAVAGAIQRALGRPKPASRGSVYGDGRAAQRIVDILEGLIISPSLLLKVVVY